MSVKSDWPGSYPLAVASFPWLQVWNQIIAAVELNTWICVSMSHTYMLNTQCIGELFISSWSSASYEENMAIHWDFKKFLSEELPKFEADHVWGEVFGPRRSSWFLCRNVCRKKTDRPSTVVFWVIVLRNTGQTAQISGTGWEHDPELMILGVGCELILNLESGRAARCHPAWSTSLGAEWCLHSSRCQRRVILAQLSLFIRIH